jgi:hypothetical protein
MSELSSQLQKLVCAAKVAGRPSDAAQARVQEALEARLGHAAVLDHGPSMTLGSAAAPTGALKAAAASVVGIALLGGAAWLYWGPHRAPHTPQVEVLGASASVVITDPVDSGTSASVASGGVAELPSAQATESKIATPGSNATRGKGRNRDRLAEEVALISRAQSEISASRPDNALRVLDDHERKFPSGILTEERIAARVQAYCALGRTTEATAQLERLSPSSLHNRRQSQAVCGGQTKSTVARKGSPATSSSRSTE